MIALIVLLSLAACAMLGALAYVAISDRIKARRMAREVPLCYGYRRVTCGKCRACGINETRSTLAQTMKAKR